VVWSWFNLPCTHYKALDYVVTDLIILSSLNNDVYSKSSINQHIINKILTNLDLNTTIWWLIVIVAHVGSSWTSSGWIDLINLIDLKMYHLMSGTILKNCPKFMTYLVSRTLILMSFKISSKVFFGVIVSRINWTCCLLVIDWLNGSSRLAQFEWNGPFKSFDACDVESLPCNSWWYEQRNHAFVLLFTNQVFFLAFTSFHSFKTYWYGTWLCVMATTTTLTSTLSGLGFFDTIVALMINLVQNIF